MHGSHLRQLFQNLIGNALKYCSAERTPVVHISAEIQGGYVVFSVNDNGIGIGPEYHKNIFDLFKRLHTSNEYEGTGLGLSLSYDIVKAHGGELKVETDTEGEGTEFIILLPTGIE